MTVSPSNFGWSRRTDKLISKTHFFRSACTIGAGAEAEKIVTAEPFATRKL
jgi:hypothetical protein